MDPVVEKAQHEPHCPWFLTGVTAPLVTQSTESARLDSSRIWMFFSRTIPSLICLYPVRVFLSAGVQVENSLMATLCVTFGSAFMALTSSKFCLKRADLNS